MDIYVAVVLLGVSLVTIIAVAIIRPELDS